jgi:hypothetical protein
MVFEIKIYLVLSKFYNTSIHRNGKQRSSIDSTAGDILSGWLVFGTSANVLLK